ncbi:MAG: EAL domain-containing protein [Thermoanaerobaculia bacterium]
MPTALTTLLMLGFGVRVVMERLSRVAGAFFSMTAAASIWLFAFTFMYCALDPATALAWARAAYFGVPFLAPAIYQFAVEMLQIGPRRRIATGAGWLLGLCFCFLGTSTGMLVYGVQRYWWGFYPRYTPSVSVPFLIFFFGYLIAALVEFVRAFPASRGMERKRIRVLIAAFAVAYLGCVDYLPKFGISIYPFGYLALLGFVVIVAAALRRYDLLAITPSIAAQEIIGTMAEALLVCDATGRIQFANRAAESLLGYEAGGLVRQPVESLLEPEGWSLPQALLEPGSASREGMFVARDGSRIDVMVSISAIVHHGEAAGVVIIGRDMREKKHSERAILKAVTLLQSTLESTADGILVTGDDGRILSYNERFVDMWQMPLELISGADAQAAVGFMIERLCEPEQFVLTVESLSHQAEAESFDLLELRDGRRFERYSTGRKIQDMANVRVWSFRDVTSRFASEAALRESEHRYRLLFEQNAAGVCLTDLQGRILDCNSTFASMLRSNREAMIGVDLTHLHARPVEREELTDLLRDARTLKGVELEFRRMDGSSLWVLQNLTLAEDRIHSTVLDISDRKRAEAQIEFHAYHDVLTQLPNRRLFTDRLTQNLTRARRFGKTVAVMFVDLDHFKKINDTMGHGSGDELLLTMADRLRTCVREDDTVARVGGDEFTICLAELRHPEDALRVAEKIIDAVEAPLVIAGISVEVTASIGIAISPVDGNDPETLIRNADSAMYRAKDAGRGTYQLCTEDMKRRASERFSLESQLKRAIAENQLILHYQPQISLTTGAMVGVEALVRWNDPQRGLIHPASFIPLAEESRLIIPLGAWVLRTACAQMMAWRKAGLALPHVAVNLSARQFQQKDLADVVRNTLLSTGLDPTSLELEITETAAMKNAEASVEVMRTLRNIGVNISIDDFGTGYSSLLYLKQFPLTCVKVDRVFVRDLDTSEGDAAIVSAVIAIARSLKLRVVAEGVETVEQLTFLRRHHCDAAQGYFFSRPVAAEAIPALLEGPADLHQAGAPRLHV